MLAVSKTSCLVRANGRHYVPGQIVILHEGIFIQLDEQDLDATTTDNATSTDYDPEASRTSTTALSSDLSLQPAPAASESDFHGTVGSPVPSLLGPFFDVDQDGALYVAGHDFDPEVVLQWFHAIAVQRTAFVQYDKQITEFQNHAGVNEFVGIVLVVTGSDWSDVIQVPTFDSSDTHFAVYGTFSREI